MISEQTDICMQKNLDLNFSLNLTPYINTNITSKLVIDQM